jgi:hypothetical protein
MDQINTLVSNDSDTPTSSSDSDEWTARLNLIYAGYPSVGHYPRCALERAVGHLHARFHHHGQYDH